MGLIECLCPMECPADLHVHNPGAPAEPWLPVRLQQHSFAQPCFGASENSLSFSLFEILRLLVSKRGESQGGHWVYLSQRNMTAHVRQSTERKELNCPILQR